MKAAGSLVVAVAIVFGLFLGQSGQAASSMAAEPRNVDVLVGAGQDTMDLQSFFPQRVRVRAGDTITWTQNSDAPHTVSFVGSFPGPGQSNRFTRPGENSIPATNLPVPGLTGVAMQNPLQIWPYPGPEVSGSVYTPGEFVSSGRFLAVPPTPGVDVITTFSLTFDTPGTYQYMCLTHIGEMRGWVEVAAASATDVPTQAEIDATAQAEIAALAALGERQRAQHANLRSEPGPNGTNIWYVSVGPNFFRINDQRAQLDEFFPKDITIRSGDSVVWGSTGFHAVTFNPSPIIPEAALFATLPDGSPAIINNPEVFDTIKPSGVFDPREFYVSGNLNLGQPGGTAWALTFETPGTFEYYCAVHRERGMTGSITVVAS